MKEQLEDIHKYVVQKRLISSFVQTCYAQTLATYKSWLTKLEGNSAFFFDKIRQFLKKMSSLVSCYRLNKHRFGILKNSSLDWHQNKDGELLHLASKNKANITLPVSDDILFFVIFDKTRKRIRFPRLNNSRPWKWAKCSCSQCLKNATHFDYFLVVETLEKGNQSIYR